MTPENPFAPPILARLPHGNDPAQKSSQTTSDATANEAKADSVTFLEEQALRLDWA
jgi:hypothetical protein